MEYRYFELWDKYTIEREKLLSGLKSKSEAEKYILILHTRINSLSDELIFLAKSSKFTSSQIILRSVIETHIDLKCLVDDDSFIDVLKKSERESEIKYLKNFDSSNMYYGSQSKDDVENILEELDRNKDKSKCMTIYQKFEKVDELDFYRTVYNHLCRHTHGNITALASKHFESGEIRLNKTITNNEFAFILSSSINIAIASSIEVLTKLEFKKNDIKVFKDLLIDVNKVAKKHVGL